VKLTLIVAFQKNIHLEQKVIVITFIVVTLTKLNLFLVKC